MSNQKKNSFAKLCLNKFRYLILWIEQIYFFLFNSSYLKRFSHWIGCSFEMMRKRICIISNFTLKSGSTVCFLNEPIINNELGSMLIILAYVDFLLKKEKMKYHRHGKPVRKKTFCKPPKNNSLKLIFLPTKDYNRK